AVACVLATKIVNSTRQRIEALVLVIAKDVEAKRHPVRSSLVIQRVGQLHMPGFENIGSTETRRSRRPITSNGEVWNAGGDPSLTQDGLKVVKGESQILLRDTG